MKRKITVVITLDFEDEQNEELNTDNAHRYADDLKTRIDKDTRQRAGVENYSSFCTVSRKGKDNAY